MRNPLVEEAGEHGPRRGGRPCPSHMGRWAAAETWRDYILEGAGGGTGWPGEDSLQCQRRACWVVPLNILVAPLRSLHGGLPWPQASSFTSALSNTADSSRGGPLGKVASGEDDGESDATRNGDAAQGSRVPMVDDLRWRWQVGSGGEQGPQARDTMGSPLTEASR